MTRTPPKAPNDNGRVIPARPDPNSKRTGPMTRHLIGAVLAASLALTNFTAAPARAADTGEIGRFLLGAGALFIIGSALSNNSSGHVERRSPPRPGVHPHPRRVLPGYCVTHVRTHNGPRRVLGRHCLRRHAGFVPNVCRWVVHGHNGSRVVYGARCLTRHGYRIH